MSDSMQRQLESYLARVFPAKLGLQITELTHMSAGWESEMYAFTVEYGPAGARQREELVLRIYPGEDAQTKSAREYRGMSQLYGAGYPVPRVMALERDDSPFDRPFVIMEKIQGEMLWPLLFHSPEEKQKELLTLFCSLLVQLHSLDWRPFDQAHHRASELDGAGSNGGSPYAYADGYLGMLRPLLKEFPIPGLLPVVEWLEERRDLVPCARPSVIHWDYHPGNILLRDDGTAAVVDWTQIDVADSRFDLAWTLLLVSTHEDEVWHERVLREYERLAGAQVEQLAFFEVYVCLKRLGSVAVSLIYGPEAAGMRPGAEEMMVQHMGVIEKVCDLLLKRTGIEVPEVVELLAQSS